MKRTTFLLLTIVSIFFSALNAAPIERATALKYAKQFVSQTPVAQYAPGKVSATTLESEPTYVADDATSGTPLYYIYNLSNNGGFVIVAADTRVRTILGYSFNGSFDKKNIPINMREWLDEYSAQIAYAIKELPESYTATTIARSPAVNNAVAPLLGDIRYNQNAPYNDLCPMDSNKRSVTGCVATAMAQVMRYHKHPQVGRGTKTYTTEKLQQELTVDFGATHYDWENMLPSYSGSENAVQKTAVATLMYHAGVAAEMNYSASSSGAVTSRGVRAMYEYFDYDKGLNEAQRRNYTAGEWLQLIKTEIDAARPIIFSGRSLTGGHAFVCDGYDADNFVHINWGWGGYQDGYFHLSAFNPAGGGIGAGDTGYNLNQTIFIGIQKPVQGSVVSGVMGMESFAVDKDSISGQETAQFIISQLRARSLLGFNGQVGIALYDENGSLVKIIRSFTTSGQLPSSGWGWATRTFSSVPMSEIRPDSTTIGNFSIKPVYRSEGTTDWKPVLVANGVAGEIYTDITASVIRFTYPEMTFTLTEAAPAVIKNSPQAIFENNNLNVELQIANFGNVEYRAQVGVKAVSLADESIKHEIANVKTILPSGETTTVNLSGLIDFPEGEYRLEAYYNPANTENDFSFPTAIIGNEQDTTKFTVVAKPAAYKLSLAAANVMPTEVEQGTPFTFKATIKNEGGLFAGNLVLRFLKNIEGTNSYRYIYNGKPHYVEIDTETKEVVMEYTLDLAPGSGYAAILHYTDNVSGSNVSFGDWRHFTIKAKPNYQVDVSANPTDGGTVTGAGSFVSGTLCTVTATPNEDFIFTNWTENDTVVSTETSYTFKVEKNRTLVANFKEYDPITVSFKKPADWGETPVYFWAWTRENPKLFGVEWPGIALTDSGNGIYSYTFDAALDTVNFIFSKQGFPQSVDITNVVQSTCYEYNERINDTYFSVKVVDCAVKYYDVSVSANPAEGGTVNGGGNFAYGTSQTVTAKANTGYSFTNWTEDGNVVSTDLSYTFTVRRGRVLVANFTLNEHQIEVSANSADGGSVKGGGTFDYGSSCTVTATAKTGYSFTNWTENGDVVSTESSYTFTVEKDRALVANFTANNYLVEVSADPAEGGTVEGAGSFAYGTSHTVTATANTGYKFIKWTENGALLNFNTTYKFKLERDRTLVAHFEKLQYNVSAVVTPAEGGTVSGTGVYNFGDECALTATANQGYSFVNWAENGTEVSTDTIYSFIINKDVELTANFKLNTSLDDLSHFNINAYTSQHKIIIENAEGWDVEVINGVGKVIFTNKVRSDKEEVTMSVPGIYIIKMYRNENVGTKKVIVR